MRSEDAQRILDQVRAGRDDWLRLVEGLVLAESPSTVPASQGPVLELLGDALEPLGFRVRRISGRRSGGLLLARPQVRRVTAFQLMLGHSDTVWPEGTLNQMPFERNESVIRGPGIFDMKAGLAQIVLALRSLQKLSLEPEVTPAVLVNSDEEIGSFDSVHHIRRFARRANRVFVLEPALGVSGLIKTRRKGTGQFSIRIFGKGAHAGLDPESGASAIQELSLVIQRLHDLTDRERNISVNVGQVGGGQRPNVVAAEAWAEIDVRVDSLDDAHRVEGEIRGLEARVPGCRIEVEGEFDRPPMEATPGNQRLWREALRLGRVLGLSLEQGSAGGASDGNLTSPLAPTLDGLGAVGDGAHASHEYVDVDRTLERCALLACLLLLPPEPCGL